MSLESQYNLALFNLDTFMKESTIVPDSLKHDWILIHGLVYHQRNTVDLAEKRKNEAIDAHNETLSQLDQLSNEHIELRDALETIKAESNAHAGNHREEVIQHNETKAQRDRTADENHQMQVTIDKLQAEVQRLDTENVALQNKLVDHEASQGEFESPIRSEG
jgi:phosphomevalonate kinase